MAQVMPLPLTVSCFSKIQVGLPFWYRLTWVVPEKGPLNVCVVVVPVLHYEGSIRALAQERFSIALAAVCIFSEFVSVAFLCFCAFKPNAFCAVLSRRAQQISYYTSYLGVKIACQWHHIWNKSAPIQLAQCRFPGLAISNAKMLIYFSNKIYGSNLSKQHSEIVMV